MAADPDAQEFAERVSAVLRRFCRQSGRPLPTATEISQFAGRMWGLGVRRGWPRPLAPGEKGEPGEMPASTTDPWVAELLDGFPPTTAAALRAPARQLIKACLQPWFRTCRESYREISPDGTCRRQDPVRVRERVSGSHCVDCPYWTSLTAEQDRRLLARSWQSGDAAVFHDQEDLFLPEDFRQLRQCIDSLAKNQGC